MNGTHTPLDTRIEIVTPENIAFGYRLAGPFRRLPAYLIDVSIMIALGLAIVLVAGFALSAVYLPGFGLGLALLAVFLLSWFYGGLFETYWNGQTPGKWLLGIRAMSVDGQPITGFQAVLRTVLRSVDAWPVAGFVMPYHLVGLAVATSTQRFQRLGDLAAGTMVVVEERQRHYGVTRIEASEAIRLAAELPRDFVVSRSLGRALSAYVQRRHLFTMRRRMEIVRHLAEPLIERFGLPRDTHYDVLVCALYYRTFVADRPVEPNVPGQHPAPPVSGSPFSHVNVYSTAG
jgi:uncharacterized RDD family membrane protein YckC